MRKEVKIRLNNDKEIKKEVPSKKDIFSILQDIGTFLLGISAIAEVTLQIIIYVNH